MYLMAEVYLRKRVELVLKEVRRKLAGGRSKFRPIIAHTHKIKLIYDNIIYAVLADTGKERVLRLPEM